MEQQIGKGVHRGCILSPCFFDFYAEYIMWNAGLNESQAVIKIAGRNINNLWYANDTVLMAEIKEELKSLLIREKEESEKVGLKLNIQKTKIMASKQPIPDHLTCLLRNLYAGQEATVRTGHGTTDWFKIGKGVCQGCILSPCLFNLYAEYIMWNAGLDEAQAVIKIAGRNINNLRCADEVTLIAESEEELKSLWWKWKRREKKLA